MCCGPSLLDVLRVSNASTSMRLGYKTKVWIHLQQPSRPTFWSSWNPPFNTNDYDLVTLYHDHDKSGQLTSPSFLHSRVCTSLAGQKTRYKCRTRDFKYTLHLLHTYRRSGERSIYAPRALAAAAIMLRAIAKSAYDLLTA